MDELWIITNEKFFLLIRNNEYDPLTEFTTKKHLSNNYV